MGIAQLDLGCRCPAGQPHAPARLLQSKAWSWLFLRHLLSPSWRFPAFAKSGQTERMWERQLPSWQLLLGENPLLCLPLVLLPLLGRVGSAARSQGPGPLHHPGCPVEAGTTSLRAPPAPRGHSRGTSHVTVPWSSAWQLRHHLSCLLPASALLLSRPGPCSCWKSRWAPWSQLSHPPVS